MRVDQFIANRSQQLQQADIPSARLDCLILLEDSIGKDRAWLLAHPEHVLDSNIVAGLDTQIGRRATHEPLAYIRNRTAFYGRTFYVDNHVLEPRPESEAIIDCLEELRLPEQPVIVDVGTGSGALAISADLELPGKATVIGTDIDPACLEVATRNAAALHSRAHFAQANLLKLYPVQAGSAAISALPPKIDIILANLPYVPNDFAINLAAGHEPRLAIFGGPDGLDLYRELFDQLQELPIRPQYVISEALPPHHEQLAAIAQKAGYGLSSTAGFVQVFTRTSVAS